MGAILEVDVTHLILAGFTALNLHRKNKKKKKKKKKQFVMIDRNTNKNRSQMGAAIYATSMFLILASFPETR